MRGEEPEVAALIGLSQRPRFVGAGIEDLLLGGRKLRAAFIEVPIRFAERNPLSFAPVIASPPLS